jgi:hypothetical protein
MRIMANKIDKEFLLKNRFWVLLGSAGLLALVCLLTLLFVGSSEGGVRQTRYEKSRKEVIDKSKSKPKNESFVTPWKKYTKIFTDQKDGVWNMAWDTQKDMFTWPDSNDTPLSKLMKYYVDPEKNPDLKREDYPTHLFTLSDPQRKEYATHLYTDQFGIPDDKNLEGHVLLEIVGPVEFNGGQDGFKRIVGPAMSGNAGGGSTSGKMGGMPSPGGMGGAGGLPGGGGSAGDRAFTDVFPKNAVPTMEEMWLVQEDFWVKRAMLQIVRDVLDKTAHFEPVEIPKEEPLDKAIADKVVARYRFRSINWEITLLIEETMDKGIRTTAISGHSTIKNVNASKRTLLVANGRTGKGLMFKLKQGGDARTITVEGVPLAWDERVEFKKSIPVASIDLKKPFDMDQELEYATSPIRRIDELRTAKNSHRLAFKPLKPNEAIFNKEAEPKTSSAGGSPSVPGGGSGGGAPAMPSGMGTGAGAAGGSDAAASLTSATPNGLERNRYILTNEQCRHLPIGMVVIADQAAINEVLIAMANSPLRIQITQVHLMHVRDPGPSAAAESSSSTPNGMDPRTGKPRPPMPNGGFPTGGFPTGGFPGGVGGPSATPENAMEDNNLFELTVYGVATLYERPKEKAKTDAVPAAPAVAPPAAPAPTTPAPGPK